MTAKKRGPTFGVRKMARRKKVLPLAPSVTVVMSMSVALQYCEWEPGSSSGSLSVSGNRRACTGTAHSGFSLACNS